jgi:hypothetical protein
MSTFYQCSICNTVHDNLSSACPGAPVVGFSLGRTGEAPTEPTPAPLASGAMTAEAAYRWYEAAFLKRSQAGDNCLVSECAIAACESLATEAAARARREMVARLEASLRKRWPDSINEVLAAARGEVGR